MISTSARLLKLVSLLSARPAWTAGELADRMAVTPRTVRRDIARLRDLGYGVESDAGPWGGYRLSPGTRLPPLSLDDEEALAVTVGLREAAFSGVLGGGEAALSALLKLRQVLPRRVAERLNAMDGAFVHTAWPAEQQVAAAVLLDLATACRHAERVRLSYRDRLGRATRRDVDPYRLVRAGRRWYLVAVDVAKGEWRTFRADRVEKAVGTGRPVALGGDLPDPAALVGRIRTPVGYPLCATVRLAVPLDEALRLVPSSVGTHREDGPDATVVEIGGTDADGMARYLLGLATPLRVLAPDGVRAAVVRRARELVDMNENVSDATVVQDERADDPAV
ncbi:YafY family protein [Streptomyces sp. RFCAC02]|uniref:helix-turn-helix transcriptional regulator n=1 Tax=Streptomyces sp. RFCAC02 TaxID=2499143 RepID=UPI00143D268F|nr:YafY family protein [Streptomyces sp. RFCAC02]